MCKTIKCWNEECKLTGLSNNNQENTSCECQLVLDIPSLCQGWAQGAVKEEFVQNMCSYISNNCISSGIFKLYQNKSQARLFFV